MHPTVPLHAHSAQQAAKNLEENDSSRASSSAAYLEKPAGGWRQRSTRKRGSLSRAALAVALSLMLVGILFKMCVGFPDKVVKAGLQQRVLAAGGGEDADSDDRQVGAILEECLAMAGEGNIFTASVRRKEAGEKPETSEGPVDLSLPKAAPAPKVSSYFRPWTESDSSYQFHPNTHVNTVDAFPSSKYYPEEAALSSHFGPYSWLPQTPHIMEHFPFTENPTEAASPTNIDWRPCFASPVSVEGTGSYKQDSKAEESRKGGRPAVIVRNPFYLPFASGVTHPGGIPGDTLPSHLGVAAWSLQSSAMRWQQQMVQPVDTVTKRPTYIQTAEGYQPHRVGTDVDSVRNLPKEPSSSLPAALGEVSAFTRHSLAPAASDGWGRVSGLSSPATFTSVSVSQLLPREVLGPSAHPFVRLPFVDPRLIPRDFLPEAPLDSQYNPCFFLGPMQTFRTLFLRPSLNSSEIGELIRAAESLVDICRRRVPRFTIPQIPVLIVRKLSMYVLIFDCLVSAGQLLGERMVMDAWWPAFTDMFKTDFTHALRNRYLGRSATTNIRRIHLLCEALNIYKRRARPEPSFIIEMKRMILDKKHARHPFTRSAFDGWRKDDQLFLEISAKGNSAAKV